jgi:hypothetical protein
MTWKMTPGLTGGKTPPKKPEKSEARLRAAFVGFWQAEY